MTNVKRIVVVAALLFVLSAGCNEEHSTNKPVEVGGVAMVSLSGGTFTMGYDYRSGGDPAVNKYYPDEQPVHEVTLSPFQISVYEVTQDLYESVTGENPSLVRGGNLPVTDVGANHAIDFCNMLSEQAGLDPCYDAGRVCDFSKNGFRLPTEAEWEYACRAGTATHFSSGDTVTDLANVGWHLGNSGKTVHPVGEKDPSACGLHDMHGNVWEWCYDGWHGSDQNGIYDEPSQLDPSCSESFNYRIIRGGGWFSAPSECRSAVRGKFWTGGGSDFIGFRVARSSQQHQVGISTSAAAGVSIPRPRPFKLS